MISKLLLKDSAWKKFISILDHVSGMADFDNYANEIMTLHKGRKSRGLMYRSTTTKRLIESSMQDISYRGRCTEIMVEVRRAQRMLKVGLDAVKNHIFAKYNQHLKAYSTKAERDSYVNNLLQDAYSKLNEFDGIVEICEIVIGDIDKTSWAYKSILQAMDLVYQRENILGTKMQTV